MYGKARTTFRSAARLFNFASVRRIIKSFD